jgi:hypothetical protein
VQLISTLLQKFTSHNISVISNWTDATLFFSLAVVEEADVRKLLSKIILELDAWNKTLR